MFTSSLKVKLNFSFLMSLVFWGSNLELIVFYNPLVPNNCTEKKEALKMCNEPNSDKNFPERSFRPALNKMRHRVNIEQAANNITK